jgi:hypothetical protein
MLATKQPSAASGKLSQTFMEPSGIARSAQMPLDIFVALRWPFRGLIDS